jgi:hypothetical protein
MAGEDTSPVGGAVNPYDFLSLIAALSASQTKPTQSGINRLFSPEVGALTGTLYQGDSGGLAQQEEAATMLRLGPDILRASNLPAGDIRAKIANMIYVQKIPVWDVKRRIDQELLQRQQMGEVMDKDATAQEMYAFADKIQSQSDSLDANMATAAAKPRTDVFSQGGLPSPEMQFAPEDLAPDYFKKYAEESAKRGELLRAIGAPSGSTLKNASKFIESQGKELKRFSQKPSTFRELYGTSGQTYVTEGQLGPYVPSGTAKTVKGQTLTPGEYDPEMSRFADVAKRIVARGPQNKELSKKRVSLMDEQRYADTVRDLVAAGLTKKAQEAGYTPLMVALLKRAQFSGLGGS